MGMIDFVIPPSVCFSGYFFGAVEPKARCFLLFASYRIVIGEVLIASGVAYIPAVPSEIIRLQLHITHA